MHRKLTITLDEEVYQGLHEHIGRGRISSFIEELVRPHVVADEDLAAEYRAMAADTDREQEALEWIEGTLGGLDEPDETAG